MQIHSLVVKYLNKQVNLYPKEQRILVHKIHKQEVNINIKIWLKPEKKDYYSTNLSISNISS